MKFIFSILMTLVLTTNVFAQTESAVYKKLADSFELYFNTGNYDAIFDNFSPDMKKALPINQTIAFFKGLAQDAGKMTKRKFIRYEQSYAVYKSNFERAIFAVNISVDDNHQINGLFLKPFIETNSPKMERNLTKLLLPFKDEWTVIWGGDTKEQNYHIESEAQQHAFDLVITDDKGNSFKTNGTSNEDYYAFGKEIIAPCDGEIVLVVDGIKDNVPGMMNPIYTPGNSVIIKTANKEYLFFAHLKQHSIAVKQGQQIKQGQLLGLCGNTGNSSEPHLHFHIQNMEDINSATGVKCYFENIIVNGELKKDYSPVQKEKISKL